VARAAHSFCIVFVGAERGNLGIWETHTRAPGWVLVFARPLAFLNIFPFFSLSGLGSLQFVFCPFSLECCVHVHCTGNWDRMGYGHACIASESGTSFGFSLPLSSPSLLPNFHDDEMTKSAH